MIHCVIHVGIPFFLRGRMVNCSCFIKWGLLQVPGGEWFVLLLMMEKPGALLKNCRMEY
jgi:hypothetical protein